MKKLLLSALLLASACATRQKFMDNCPGMSAVDSSRVAVALDIKTVAGSAPFSLGATERAQDGVEYRISKFRYYLSEVALINEAGETIAAPLATAGGVPLRYGVALVDHSVPESMQLSVLAPPGDYRAMNLTFGVPNACPGGQPLNHGDASARMAPLDVDSDMYWSWNPNYIFLKIEGQALVDGKPKSFFYHVGEDARRAHLHIHTPIHVAAGQPAKAELIMDVNRLFVTKDGEDKPRLEAGDGVHGGAIADQVAANMAESGFVRPVHPGVAHAAR